MGLQVLKTKENLRQNRIEEKYYPVKKKLVNILYLISFCIFVLIKYWTWYLFSIHCITLMKFQIKLPESARYYITIINYDQLFH